MRDALWLAHAARALGRESVLGAPEADDMEDGLHAGGDRMILPGAMTRTMTWRMLLLSGDVTRIWPPRGDDYDKEDGVEDVLFDGG